jgi:hypothetical protein
MRNETEDAKKEQLSNDSETMSVFPRPHFPKALLLVLSIEPWKKTRYFTRLDIPGKEGRIRDRAEAEEEKSFVPKLRAGQRRR